MPHYQFTAVGRDGQNQSGREFAESLRQLETKLKERRLILLKAQPVRSKTFSMTVTLSLISQLAKLLTNGVVLEQTLRIIAEHSQNRQTRQLAGQLSDGIKRGQTLSDALAEAGRFDQMLIPLVRAGETSGALARIMIILDEYYRQRLKVNREISASLAYPIVLMIACVLSLGGLGVYVIPVFKELFTEDMKAVPATTVAVFALSDAIVAHGRTAVLALLAAIGAATLAPRFSPAIAEWRDGIFLKLPMIGSFISKRSAANVTGVLGILLKSGLPLTRALELALDVVSNRRIRDGLERTLEEVRRGRRIATALAHVPAFPGEALQLIVVGEETGRLSDLCQSAADALNEETAARLKSMVALLGPALILVMGASVGFVVVSMLLAVYSLSGMG